MLAYVLVLQGISGAAASGLFIPIASNQTILICQGSAERSSGEQQPLHDMACCLAGCLVGGALLGPPGRPAVFPPGWHMAQGQRAAVSLSALPRAPTAAFQPRGPPVVS